MIYDTLAAIEQYDGIHPGVLKGLRLLRDTDFSKIPDGRYELDGSDMFYMLQSYETKPANPTLEAHRKYIDIQFLISGQEYVDVESLPRMVREVEGHPERDIWFYEGPSSRVLLGDDRYLVLWPNDPHAPCIAVDKPIPCRKCVVKVRVDRNAD